MLGELILVRHGKAESKETAKPDFDRKLTEKGAQEFQDFMAQIIPLLKEKQGLKVWTSPLVRARETADILTDALGISRASDKQFLADGNLNGLLKELKAEGDGFAVVCVGHEPFMSIWSSELTGATLPFPKGGVMNIVFDDPDAAVGKVDWKLAPKEAKKW